MSADPGHGLSTPPLAAWALAVLAVPAAVSCGAAPATLAAPPTPSPSPRTASSGPPQLPGKSQDSAGPRRSGSLAAGDYLRRPLRGFDLRVAPPLLEGGDREEAGARAMDALDADLGEIVRRLPSAAVQHLRTVPIFLGVADPVTPCACYHKSPEWLAGAGFDPAKARSVEIANASTFLDWRRGQPSMVLHELSHAYHHQVLGTDDEDILAAFRAAADSGRYDRVVRHRGNVERHYALTNVDEYFAETSEALFGVNDFYPFLLGELLAVDPGGAAAVARAWKADTPTPMKPDLETCAAKEIPALHRFFDDWFAGRVDDTDGAFLRMESALAPGFRMVTPDGALRTRDEILGAVRAGHGVGDRNISATVIEVRLIDAVHALVVYEESQRSGTGEPRVLLSTALVQRSPGAPGGLLWVHVHETERAP